MVRELPEGSRLAGAIHGVRGVLTTSDALTCMLIDAINDLHWSFTRVNAAEGSDPERPARTMSVIGADPEIEEEEPVDPTVGLATLMAIGKGG